MPAFHEFLLGTINGRVQLQVQGPIPRAFMLHRKWNERSTGGVSRCPKECTIWVGSARQIRPSVRLASRIKSASSGIRQRLGSLEQEFSHLTLVCKAPFCGTLRTFVGIYQGRQRKTHRSARYKSDCNHRVGPARLPPTIAIDGTQVID